MINCNEIENHDERLIDLINRPGGRHEHKYTTYSMPR